MVRRCVATLLAVALAGPPGQAGAQGPASPGAAAEAGHELAPPAAFDTVVLRDGTVLRGTILELHPGREVVISLVGGTRRIGWAEVASTHLAGTRESLGTGPKGHVQTSPAGADSEDDEPAPGPSRPRITIELTRPADVHLLEAGTPTGMKSGRYYPAARSVCRAPCGRVIDGRAGYPFYFGGPGMLPSRPFFLRDLEGEYVARVRPGRLSLFAGGVVTLGLGYGGALSGGLLLGISRESEGRVAGGVLLGVGVALLVAGVAMAVRSATRVRLERRR